MSAFGWFIALWVLCSAVLGVLLRSMAWRTVVVLATLLACVTAMAVFLPWEASTYEKDRYLRGWDRVLRAGQGWFDEGPNGTYPRLLGPIVFGLEVVATILAASAATADGAPALERGRRRMRTSAVGSTLALLVLAYVFAARVDRTTVVYAEDIVYTGRAGIGLLLALLTAFFASVLAWVAFARASGPGRERAAPRAKHHDAIPPAP